MVVELGSKGLVGCFTEAMRREVEGNGQVFVLLNGGAEPLLAVFCEVVVRQERHCERDVRFGWCKITEKEGFVDDVESSAAAWFFEIGGHAPDGVDF